MTGIKCFPIAAALLSALVLQAESAWDHSLYTSSPPVYPSPNITGSGGWSDALVKAKAFVSQLSLEEKAWMVTGTTGPCVGSINPIPRLNFSGLCLQDGPAAIRQATYATVYPAGIAAAASWDKELIYQRGLFMGQEFKTKGSHISLAPVCGPLGRSPYGGRNWEGFSVDPYLTGVAMEKTVAGMQKAGVQATPKHYIGNEQETQRNPSQRNGVTIEAISSNIDDRTMHELYLWPFADAVHAGAASVMCSYNRLNASYGCQNSKTLNGLLKTELGFQGYVMSDWGAVHAGVDAIQAGLDMNMPGGLSFTSPTPSWFGENITIAVRNGSLPESRVNDMILRILTPYYHLGQDKAYPPVDKSSAAQNSFGSSSPSNWTLGPIVDARENHAALVRDLGAQATILLKNVNGTLPLKNPKNIAVIGNDASEPTRGLYPLNFGTQTSPEYGPLAVGGGSGTGRFANLVTPLEALKAQGKETRALVQYILDNQYIAASGLSTLAPPPEVCIVFLKSYAAEGIDRNTLLPDWNSTAVVAKTTASCSNTVVIVHGTGPVDMPWASNLNITAILLAHMPGEEAGNSIVDVLWGKINPSGRLPYTIAKTPSDYPNTLVNSTKLATTTDPNAWQADFIEGQLIDYRYFDASNKTPMYEFGFGLSYTTFSVSNIVVNAANGTISRTPSATAPIIPGGNQELWQTVATVQATVTNTGSVAGKAVPQMYLSRGLEAGEGTPLRELRGFEKLSLNPGESAPVTFPLLRRDVSYWDVVKQNWVIPGSGMRVSVGLSSRDLPLQADLNV